MSPDSLMEIVAGRSMKQEALDAASRIESPRPLGRGVRQPMVGIAARPAHSLRLMLAVTNVGGVILGFSLDCYGQTWNH